MDWISLILALCMGIALSAACGLRVFLPMLALAAAGRWGGVPIAEDMAWLLSDAALICLAVASVLEIAAYYIPWVDNALDAIQSPLALVAGALVTAGVLTHQPDWLQWSVGVIAGAGAAGGVKALASTLRLGSSTTTGGLANWIFATLENILAFVGALLALVAPVLAALGLVLFLWLLLRLRRRLRRNRQEAMTN